MVDKAVEAFKAWLTPILLSVIVALVERAERTVSGAKGKRLTYRRPDGVTLEATF